MFPAAQALLDLLDPAARLQIQFPFESSERFNWSYVPQARRGLPVHAMTAAQRRALHALLREALSSAGYLKATGIMQLETVLRALEHDNPQRDPEAYYLTIFGTPAQARPWAWRIEGHHVSLNFTVASDTGVATTPAFLGADPIARLARFEGVPAAEMSGLQRELMLQLIREYTHNLTPALAQTQLDKIMRGGLERLHFAWAGSL